MGNDIWNIIRNTVRVANTTRRYLKGAAILGMLHLFVLLAVHCIIMAWFKTLFNGWNAAWGTLWAYFAMMVIFTRGGIMLDGIATAAAAGEQWAEDLIRAIIGFFTIEALINVAFMVFPLYASWKLTLCLFASIMLWLLLGVMVRRTLNWNLFVPIALINLIVMVSGIVYYRLYNEPPTWSEPAPWFFTGIILMAGAWLFPSKIASFGTAVILLLVGLGIEMGLGDRVKQYRPVANEYQSSLLANSNEALRVSKNGASKELDGLLQQLKDGRITRQQYDTLYRAEVIKMHKEVAAEQLRKQEAENGVGCSTSIYEQGAADDPSFIGEFRNCVPATPLLVYFKWKPMAFKVESLTEDWKTIQVKTPDGQVIPVIPTVIPGAKGVTTSCTNEVCTTDGPMLVYNTNKDFYRVRLVPQKQKQ